VIVYVPICAIITSSFSVSLSAPPSKRCPTDPLKDFWQERSHYVANTRWWPPFCPAVDWLVAVVLVIEIVVGVGFHH
jgi:hypothetical protein